MTALPLVTGGLDRTVAWCGGRAVTAGRFVAEAAALAETLPPAGRAVNLCQDRYRFALGLAAALLRGHTSLLPPNALPATLAQLPPGAAPYFLHDAADAVLPAGSHAVRIERPAAVAALAVVPLVDAGLDAVCLLTSGSTGAPQPHAKRWGPLVANIAAEAQRLAQYVGAPSLDGLALVATVPPQHSYGLESTVLLALLGGAALEAGRPFYPADIAHALDSVPAPRALVTTPFHLKTLLMAGVKLPPLALMLSATAPLSPQLAQQAEAAAGGPLAEIYGCTEAGQVASRRTTEGDVWTTLGELRIEQGGDDGACRVSGGHVVEPTPLADVLELHSPTTFRLLGRANDLIHVAGKRSSLAYLNFQLNRVEGVEDGAFWLPDDVAEAVVRPVAFVVAPALSAAEVIAALRRVLEPAFVPRRVVHVAALPREATGKLTAAALRHIATGAGGATVEASGAATPAPRTADRPGAPEAVEITVPTDHPAFAGHFPGRPVLPGAALLALVLRAARAHPAWGARLERAVRIDAAKFLQPVGPGAGLRLTLAPAGARGVAFEVRTADDATVVARGTLSATA